LGVGLVWWFLIGGKKGVPAWLSVCLVLFGALLILISFKQPRRRFNLKRSLRSSFPGIFAPDYIPGEPSPERTAEDVERIVRREFPAEEFADVMAILNEYVPRYNDRPFTVQLAALRLANGSVPRLRNAIESARLDYRDVIMPAVCPSYSKIGGILRKDRRGPSERERRKIFESERQQYEDWIKR
jgi:hypothetical protein